MFFESLESRQMFAVAGAPSPTPDPAPQPYDKPPVILQFPGSPIPQLNNGLLRVNGTDQNDSIDVRMDYKAAMVRVWINGADFAYPAGSVSNLDIFAGKGNDVICAEILPSRNMRVFGEEGDDFINAFGYGGSAEYHGGAGRDTLTFQDRTYAGVRLTIDRWEAGAPSGEFLAAGEDFEQIIGTNRDDQINIENSHFGMLIHGLGGRDQLTGSPHNDVLFGDEGDDRLRGGDGDDYLVGGAGRDSLYGEGNNDTLVSTDGEHDYLEAGAGEDTAYVDIFDEVSDCEHVFRF